MKKFMALFFCCFFLTLSTGCIKPKYIEKTSEEMSQAVYATKDSIGVMRIDLAAKYSDAATRLVPPPKNRIKIEAILKKSVGGGKSETIAILPASAQDNVVVIENSPEYKKLMEDLKIAEQFKQDALNWELYSKEMDRQIADQYKINNEMVVRIQDLEKQILQKDKKIIQQELSVLWRNIVIVGLIAAIAAGIYLRIKGIL